MAGVDALLNLTLAQGAEALDLAAGAVPALIKAGERRELSMPPLEPAILRRFVAELRAMNALDEYAFEVRGVRTVFAVAVEGELSLQLRRKDVASLEGTPAGTIAPQPGQSLGAAALEGLVQRALELKATDLFLSTSADARLRIQRNLEEIPETRASEADLFELLRLDERQRRQLDDHGSVDLALDFGAGRVRANAFRHQHGIGVALRPIQRRIRSLAELGLPSDLRALAEYPDGLVLFVGPTGSGKSSTLAALIEHLNRSRARHVVTLEDPIEFEYEPARCLIHQREVGRHVESFAAGLRAALRESPDVILLGEMRDPETIAAALTAAETGHLVLSTLHAASAAMAIDRIIDGVPPHQQAQVRLQLAGVLRAVVTQLLLPSQRRGGLVPAVERVIVTHAIAFAIRDGRGHQIASHIQTGRDEGMLPLEVALADLVRRGEISAETARQAARSPDLLRGLLAE